MTKRTKLLVTILCLVCVLCTLVTGTIAWLTHKTGTITNTFTATDITVTLTETGADADDKQSFPMVPGATISKAATVEVNNNVACYVFLKVETAGDVGKHLTYAMGEGWKVLDATNHPGVYYRAVGVNDTVKTWPVLDGNKVTVNTTVTKQDMADLKVDGATLPTLTFTASAIQSENLPYTADDDTDAEKAVVAWNTLNGNN